ncbi:MAG: hypothetical protein D4S01_08680 [Dehalococcoidia bacterium]|nr:MAG: hypothetical protein D4S01_08680 [Dehalococcoidia bacterium]
MKEKKLKLHCCERCQFYWTCDTKWYRGERHEEDICCPRCNFFTECLSKLNRKDKATMMRFNEDKLHWK